MNVPWTNVINIFLFKLPYFLCFMRKGNDLIILLHSAWEGTWDCWFRPATEISGTWEEIFPSDQILFQNENLLMTFVRKIINLWICVMKC